LNLLSYSNIDISPCLNAKNSYSFILWWTHIPTYTNSQIQLKNIPTSITIWLSLTALFVTMTMLYWSIVEWHSLPSVHLSTFIWITIFSIFLIYLSSTSASWSASKGL
jgi:hypothetical protein